MAASVCRGGRLVVKRLVICESNTLTTAGVVTTAC